MKKIALNLLKSADEKLRSIGNKPQQPQQQPLHQQHQLYHHHHPHQQQQAPPPVPAREPVMAERRVQMRQGRRDRRRDGDGDAELKRRSRSEGPSGRRVAQSMDVSSGHNNHNNNSSNRRVNQSQSQSNASFERREARSSRLGRNSPPGSDDGGFVNPDPSGSDSDSDSDRMQWTKNPLLVRKMKKNKAEKRSAAAENSNNSSGYKQLGQRSTNRESWVYLAPEGTPVAANQDQQRGDGGSNSGSLKSKYQKLEEMRKKRIDMAMTSDEENTPESRISRLRQRALQGALGNQPRADNSRVIVSDHNDWNPAGAKTGPAVMSDQGSRQSCGQPANQPVAAQPQAYRSGVVVPAQPANRHAQQAFSQSGAPRQTGLVAASKPITPQRNLSQAYQQPARQSPAPVRQSLVKPFTDRGATDGASPSTPTARQQFYTIPEPHVGNRAVHNSSPEIHVRRFNQTVRVPSADSIYDSVNYPQDPDGNRHSVNRPAQSGQRAYAQVNPPTRDVMEIQRDTAVQYQIPANQRPPAASQFNEVVELRLKSSRVIDRPVSQSFKETRGPRRQAEGFHSEDSLDELIESNIQYLEKEINQGGPAKKTAAISRSTSLPDPRKTAGIPCKPKVTVSGQQSVRPAQQTTALPQNNKSELHFRVPLTPPMTNQPAAPQIHIAEENQWSDSAYPGPNTSYTFGVVPRAERKHSYDSRTRTSRPTSEYYDRDDLSKSDTQLNAAVVPPTYRGAMLHPNYAAGRGCVSDQNLTVDQTQGMFSDVEYDIEVSERVKKWEKFMKKPEHGAGGDAKKLLTLTPIEERTEGDRDSLMMPSEVRKSLRMNQHGHLAASPNTSFDQSVVSLKPANSDPTLHIAGDARVLSKETNLHRFFQVVQDPATGLQIGPHLSHSTSSVYIDLPQQGPQVYSHSSTLYHPGSLMSPDELRQHMLANQRNRAQTERTTEPPLEITYGGTHVSDSPETMKRLSRYQDEIDEMKAVKHQSVSNLRRRFDETKGMTSEEESQTDSRVAKVSPTQKEEGDVNWSQMITGLEDKIRDMEVWSPNMESTQGNVVSIERVKARTLQTIPFSEDPFWKEIEEMTTFDPNSLGGHLAVSEESLKPSMAQPAEASSHSSTLPTQPRQHSAMSLRERLQRSKSLYTPNITPLTINVDSYPGGKSSSLERGTSTDKYSGPNALDEVLEDIRSSLERKPLSPKRRAGESSDSHRSSPGPNWTADLMRSRSERTRGTAGHPTEPAAGNARDKMSSSFSNHVAHPVSITISSSQKPVQAAAAVTGMTAGHYHLDPNLLKQKLLSTGLVEEDKPEVPARNRMPALASTTTSVSMSKPVAVAPPQTVVRSVVAPTQRAAPHVPRPPQQQDKLSQVNDSMDELRQLAVDVEQKIGVIKSRLLTADDQNLDKILLALRKFAPSAGPRSPDIRTGDMREFYHSKKTKLQDALSELERIYASLDLNNDMLLDRAERRDYPSYRTKPAEPSVGRTTTANLNSTADVSRPKASSIYISPLPVATVQAETSPYPAQKVTTKAEVDRQTQSEFDMISKSFQAIIDEVNKTASLVSSASTPQSRPQPPLPEIKELQSKVYASKGLDFQKHAASPETSRRMITVNSQETKSPAGPTPKSPPAVAPKPSFRVQTPVGLSASMPQPIASGVTSIVRAEVAKPAPEKREPRVRTRFRAKTANQEKEDANRRARSKSSPTISMQDLPISTESGAVSSEKQTTAKSQLNFQIEPAASAKVSASKKPPLHLDVARAQQGATVEVQLKPPAMFQDKDVKVGLPVAMTTREPIQTQVVPQPFVVKPAPDCAPPLDSKTVVYPGSPTTTDEASVTAASAVTEVPVPAKNDASSSESSAENRERKHKQRFGRGVAMMVELFSSSDEERLRRSHPLHTRSAPDLSADVPSDDVNTASKDAVSVRPAELSKVLQQKSETEVKQGSPITERKGVSSGQSPVVQNEAVSSPQSPSNKPPFHPFKRQQRSPDRASENSPQKSSTSVSEGPAASSENTVSVTNTSDKATPAASKVTPRVRPARASKADEDDDVPERPRSFHELLSSFEPNPQRLSKLRTLRKCASEEMFLDETVMRRVYRASSVTSEPDLRGQQDAAPTPQEVRQWKLR